MTVRTLGVAGAGTMGAGIAQLGCLAGLEVRLFDPVSEALETGRGRVVDGLRKGAERGRWGAEEAKAATERLQLAPELSSLAGCDLVIEAGPEDLALKRELFAELAAECGDDTLLATNTSSLPVTEIAAEVPHPERVLGMHFFNPPPLMPLVEIVAGERTAPDAIESATVVARAMGRTPIRCADSPGFIVNRCNRPFTLESLRILAEGEATAAQIDAIVREDGGYRMGPFELMDLIGIDVNLEVARSFYRQRPEPRWQPHPIQEQMVAAGRLGRKTGRGFHDYGEDRGSEQPRMPDAQTRRAILERIVAQLVNEACFAADEGVASPADVDEAMKLGLNHPRGPFEWLEELGPERVVAQLESLEQRTGDPRYRAAPRLLSAGSAEAAGSGATSSARP